MAYFNYHSKIKGLLNNGKLDCYYFENNYKNIGFALVLSINGKKYPIREHHFDEYFNLIGKLYDTTKQEEIYKTTFKNKN